MNKFKHPWFELDELYNSAYIFFTRAIESYKSDGGRNFIGWFAEYYLRRAFNYAALGENYSKRNKYTNDALNNSPLSIDAEIEGAEGATLSDIIADPNDSYEDADDRIKKEQLKITISKMLNELPIREKDVLVDIYFNNKSLRELGKEMGITAERVRVIKNRAIHHIISKHCNKEILKEYVDWATPWYLSTGAHSEQSPVERIVERRERIRKRYQFRSEKELEDEIFMSFCEECPPGEDYTSRYGLN